MDSFSLPKPRGRKLPSTKLRSLRMAPEEWVDLVRPQDEATLPVVFRAAADGLDLARWAEQNRALIDSSLLACGALLFRGFGLDSLADFERFVRVVSGELIEYHERSSPRSEMGRNIYTSTDAPAHQSIFLHNENSYQHRWPLKIFLFCRAPARQGGETPLADCRKVLRRIPPQIIARFEERQVMYLRNFGDGLGLTWEQVFRTADRARVEAYCRLAGIEFFWKDGNRLRTRQVRPAIVKHPLTGEAAWFNQAALFHVTTLESTTREQLLAEFDEEDLPLNSYYGDGSPIEPSVLDEVREAYRRETVTFAWRKGDLLMLDNVLVAHGRSAFAGQREVLVGMAEPCAWAE
jgi:alpha-ketoglutarate-dependent taurine dioxygenase